MKYRVNKLTAETLRKRSGSWNDDFRFDMVNNGGKVINITEYSCDDDEVNCTLKTQRGVEWHNGGLWYFSDDKEMFDVLFSKHTELPEELFTI
jgi:hypothetical protein